MRRTLRAAVLAVLCLSLVAGKCGGGDGDNGSPSVREVTNPVITVPPPRDIDFVDPAPMCGAVSSNFPAGFDFVPGDPDRAWVVDFSPPTLVPFDLTGGRPTIAVSPPSFVLPFDSDGDGNPESVFAPILDDIHMVASDLALVTASSYEEVIFFSPQSGGLRSFDVSVPASFAKADNPLLPDPGTTGARTGLSTFACVRPPLGALDSRGAPIATSVPAAGFCDVTMPSYLATFTAGAAVAADRLFVATSNLGDDAGSANPQYLPGAVLVYDFDALAGTAAPNAAVPVIGTTAFNPTHVTAHSVAGRDFVLVTLSGAIGIQADDPGTPEIEGGGVALSAAAVDVIDAQTLELVATYPLGLGALSGEALAIDASGRVAVAGSVARRELYAVDLSPLPGLPSSVAAPIVLGDVIFDADSPFDLPGLPSGGAPPQSCPGSTTGVSFNDAGDLLYASDSCDGTLSVIGVDTSGAPPSPLPSDRFDLLEVTPITSPLRADTLGDPRSPGRVAVRPGEPGIDYVGRDFLFLLGLDGALCSIGIESGVASPAHAAAREIGSALLPSSPTVSVREAAPVDGDDRDSTLRIVPAQGTGDILIADLSGVVFSRLPVTPRYVAGVSTFDVVVAPAWGETSVQIAQELSDGRRSPWRRVDLSSFVQGTP